MKKLIAGLTFSLSLLSLGASAAWGPPRHKLAQAVYESTKPTPGQMSELRLGKDKQFIRTVLERGCAKPTACKTYKESGEYVTLHDSATGKDFLRLSIGKKLKIEDWNYTEAHGKVELTFFGAKPTITMVPKSR